MIAKYGVTRRRTRHTAVRPAAGLLAAGAVLAALAGCGGSSSPQPAFTPAGGQGSSSGPGSGVINGIPTTRYEGSYSVADEMKKLPPGLRKITSQSIAALGITKVHFTIWIDGKHQMRRVITVEKGSSSTITTKLDIISINQPVNVTLPPPSQVTSPPASLGASI